MQLEEQPPCQLLIAERKPTASAGLRFVTRVPGKRWGDRHPRQHSLAALGLTPQLLQLARLLRRSVILTGNTHKHHVPKSITATCSAASVNVVAPLVQVMGVSPTNSRAAAGAGESKRIVAVRGSGLSLKTVK